MASGRDDEIKTLLSTEGKKDIAFGMIVEDYGEKLYRHIRRMVLIHQDADDILQDSFLKAYLNISSFRAHSQLFTWLYRIATNESLNFLKKKKRSFVFSALSYEDKLVDMLREDEFFDGNKAEFLMKKAILSLPEKQRLVFHLRYYDEMKYEYMSEILGTSTGALKASYHHAVKKIETYLNQHQS